MSKYIESPLGKIIANTLLKINELRMKYPVQKKDSIEKVDADQVLNVIETVLTKLHTEVFPKFDDQNKPGLVGIIKDLYGLKGMGEHFVTRKYKLFQDVEKILPALIKNAVKQTPEEGSVNDTLAQLLRNNKAQLIKNAANIPGTNLDELFVKIENAIRSIVIDGKNPEDVVDELEYKLSENEDHQLVIHHPMIFELGEAIAGFIQGSPTELKYLVPFFNPEALQADLHNGVTGSIIGGLFGRTFVLENIKNEDLTPSYTYNFRTFINASESKKTIAGSTFYNRYFGFIPGLFESETARADLLQQLVDGESDKVTSLVKKRRQYAEESTDYEQYKGKELICALKRDLKSLDELVYVNQQLLDDFDHRASNTVNDLLMFSPTLRAKMRRDRDESGLDVSYINNRLPESIVGYSNKTRRIEIIPIRTALDSAIKSGVSDLSKINAYTEQKRGQLTVLLDNAIKAWKKEILDEHAKHITTLNERLKQYQETLGKITVASEPVASSNEIELLESMIKVSEQKVKENESLLQSVTLFLSEVEKPTLSSSDLELDSNGSLGADQDKITQPLIEATRKLLEEIHVAQQQLQKERDKLLSRLEKAKADAEFVKSLASANPDQVRELLNVTESKLKALQEKQEKLEEQGKLISLELKSKKSALKELQEIHKNQRTTLEEISARDDKLLDKIFAVIEEHDLPNEREETKEKLLNSDDLLQNIAYLVEEQMSSLADKQKYIMGLDSPQYYKNLQIIFNQVKELLFRNKDDLRIPFKAIDELPGLVGSGLPNSLNGFNLLLNLIGLDKELDWKKYRSRQDDLFRFKPEKEKFIFAVSLLFQNIALAVDANKKNLAASEKSDELLQEIDSSVLMLREIKVEMQSDIEQKIKIETDLLDTSTLDELTSATKNLQQKLDENNLEFTPLGQEIQQVQNMITALKPITEILEKANELNEKINVFGQKRSNFMTDESLFRTVMELKALLNALDIQITEAEMAISKLDNAVDYQANFEMIHQVMTVTNERLIREIKEKFNADFLLQLIDNNEEKLKKLNQSYEKLAKMITKEGIQSLLNDYSDLAQSLNDNHSILSELGLQFSYIQDVFCSKEIITKLRAHEQIQNRSEQFGLNMTDQLITFFNAQSVNATLFDIKIPNESKEKQQENNEKLAETRKLVVDTVPDEMMPKLLKATGMCVKSCTIEDKIQAVNQAKIQALNQLELNEKVNSNLLMRITERDETANELIEKLDDYAKRKISAERIEFIKLLKKISVLDKIFIRGLQLGLKPI